jgi:hypothetical protein
MGLGRSPQSIRYMDRTISVYAKARRCCNYRGLPGWHPVWVRELLGQLHDLSIWLCYTTLARDIRIPVALI